MPEPRETAPIITGNVASSIPSQGTIRVDDYVGLPADPKMQYVAVRSYPTEMERALAQQQLPTYWAHIRPGSVLIAPMGFHYEPGSWQRIVDMMMRTCEGVWREVDKEGQKVKEYVHLPRYAAFSEIQDRCFESYDAIGTMRNEALMQAQGEGFEYVCYIDTDVLPEPDCLLKLLECGAPIVAPFVVEPGTGKPLHGPHQQPNTGLRLVKWCVLSMLLFKVAVFRSFPVGMFWGNAIGADEGFHFERLYLQTGLQPFIHTDVPLVVGKRPTYPLAINRMSWADRERWKEESVARRQRPPDRRPIDPDDKRVRDGAYMPFAPPEPVAPPSDAPVLVGGGLIGGNL